jgi:predicted amidohydrolase
VLSAAAAAHGVHVIAGILERSDDGGIRDSAVLIDSSGRLADVYRRTHLRPEEREILTPGDSVGPFKTDLATIAICIGYDLTFPELARVQALEGAEIVVALAAVDDETDGEPLDSLVLQCRSRATENFVFYVGCNVALGTVNDARGSRSVIASCNGEVLAAADERGEEVVRGTLAELAFREQRMYLTIFRDRRPEAYGLLVEGEVR